MTRTSREIAAEILRRAERKEREIKRWREHIKTAGTAAVLLGVGGLLFSQLDGQTGAALPAQAWTSTPLMWVNVGGYVLAGVICFALGAAVTLPCLRFRRQRKK